MNMLKKLAAVALMGGVALPLGGATAALVGEQAAGAAAPPLLTCQAIAPGSGTDAAGNPDGGVTFDTASGGASPGSTAVYFNANPGGNMTIGATANNGATSLVLTDPVGSTALATTNQVITIANTVGTYTVTSDSFSALPNTKGQHTPDNVTITPALTTTEPLVHGVPGPIHSGNPVTVPPSTTTPFRSVTDGQIYAATVGQTLKLTSATASFVNAAYPAGDVGAPVAGEFGGEPIGVAPSGFTGNGFQGNPTPGAPLEIASVQSSTQVTLTAVPTEQDNSTTPPTWNQVNASGGVITIGETLQAPASIYADQNLAASNCGTGLANVVGDFAPLTANLVGSTTGTEPNAALGLEATPGPLALNVTYPTLGSGWADSGGYPNSPSQPTTSLTLGGKNAFVLLAPGPGPSGACGVGSANCDSYTNGVATGDYPTTSKGNLGLEVNGMIFCTLAETQAINAGTGPDFGTAPTHIPLGADPLKVCDGAPHNPFGDTSEATALGVIITLELNPSGAAYGSDNTSPNSIWLLTASNASNAVW